MTNYKQKALDHVRSYEKKHVAERLRWHRKVSNLSKEEMAKNLQMSRSSYYALERGAKHLKLQELVTVAQLFECSLDDLVFTYEYDQ